MSYGARGGHSYGNNNRHSSSNRSIYSVQAERSAHARALDAAFKAPLAKTDEQWMNDPSHYDWPNIDTPKVQEVVKEEQKKQVAAAKDPFAVPNEKERNYWFSLTPMKRYELIKELERETGGKKFDFKALWGLIAKRGLADKLEPKIEKKLEPIVVETKKTEVLIQPELVKTNSITEATTSRPEKAKSYATGGQSFEVLESEYIARQIEKNKSRYNANIKWYEEQISEVSKDPHITERRKKNKIEELEYSIKAQKIMLDHYDRPESRASYEHSYKEEYIRFIKDSIKHGKPVPQEVIAQRPEFQVAHDARMRYEKGLHTSFANKSAAVNAVMFLEKGYKVKRQDGKSINDSQISEIGQGVEDIQLAVGPTKDIMEKADLTIAHTSGKYPFLMVAGGVYHPKDKTITMGIAGIKSLAHEWAHWLDYEGGRESKYGYEFYTNGKTSKRIDSNRTALSKAEEGSGSLCTDAAWTMHNPRELRDIYQAAYGKSKQVTPEQRKDAREVVARVGGYWRDPREVWARLVEQYVAVVHGKKTEAAESPEYYYKHPAYWSKEQFEKYQPLIKSELERRISIARGD